MKSTAAATALSRELADKIAKRTGKTVRQANDANGWPMLFVSTAGNEAAGQPVIGIRISNPDAVSKDIFGNATSAYAPHNLEIAYELTATDNPVAPDVTLLQVCFEATKTGVKQQIKEIANGTAVSEASMNAAAVAVEMDELYWPLKSI